MHRLRLLGVQGSNRVMEGELRRLARRALEREEAERLFAEPLKKMGQGALALPFDPVLGALLATYHRTSARLLWDLFELAETRLEPLYERLVNAVADDPREFLGPPGTRRLSVEASGQLPVSASSRQVVGAVKNALVDGARRRGVELSVDPDHPDLVFSVRALELEGAPPRTTVSLDVAGRPLHERGYRTWRGEAPLREDLAALLVMLTRFDARTECLIDPMAGSGTIAIEAALLAQGRTLWTSGRSPLLTTHPTFEAAFARFGPPLFGDTRPSILAAEVDPATADVQERARQTAGVEPLITSTRTDFRDVDPGPFLEEAERAGRSGGVLLTNPPYGGRLSYTQDELLGLYSELADFWRKLPGFRAALFVGEPDNPGELARVHLVERAFGGRPRVHKPLKNGPMRASFLLYE